MVNKVWNQVRKPHDKCTRICMRAHKHTNRAKARKEKTRSYVSLGMVWKLMEASMKDTENG
jgi:hypothetical protein